MVIHVHPQLNVQFKMVEHYVNVLLITLEIHLEIALRNNHLPNSLNVEATMIVPQHYLALMLNVEIHAQNVIHVHRMQIVEFHYIVHCAIVQLDGVVIHKLSVINVSYF